MKISGPFDTIRGFITYSGGGQCALPLHNLHMANLKKTTLTIGLML